jgi:galactose mutarotase-like enzyme
MSCTHREEHRDGRVLDVLTDEAAGLRLIVSRLGAELISIARRDGRGEWVGFLHRDNNLSEPESGWGNHATVMGYYLHRLKEQRSTYRGKPIEGGTHGFLRTKEWGAPMFKEERALTYTMRPGDYSPTEYPLAVSLDLTYAIEGDVVRTTFDFRNEELELTAHIGFGLHPGFAAESFESFTLDMPAGVYRRHFSPTNFLSGETAEIRHDGGEMPFAREKLSGSYILEFVEVPNRTFTFHDPPSGRSVAIEMQEAPYVTIWSDGGAFLCIEPCWGLTDHHEQRPFEAKAGIQTIEPGKRLSTSFTMLPKLGTAR